MPGVRVVTDSACDLPDEMVARHGLDLRRDAGAEGAQGRHGRDGHQREDQAVLRQTLALFAALARLEPRHRLHHELADLRHGWSPPALRGRLLLSDTLVIVGP